MSTPTDEQPGTAQQHLICRLAAALLEACDQVATTPTWSMSVGEQRQALVDLDRLGSRLDELRLRVLAAADRDDVAADSGASSTEAWLASATRQLRAKASGDVRLALALDERFEVTRTALAEGRLSLDHARVIVTCVDDLPKDVDPVWRDLAEAHLVEQASTVDARVLRILGRRIFEVLDPATADAREGAKLEDEERRARARARLVMRDNGDGTHSGAFTLPDLQAAMLKKALQALASPRRVGQARVDPETGRNRPYPELLGEAFCELLERYPGDRLPAAGGVNASIVVTLDYDALASGVGAAALDDGTRISAGEARRIACGAGIIPLVLGGRSIPLDVGQERRLHDRYQRLVLAQRDGGCTAEGCDRPPSWCEAHHDQPWAEGGPTDVEHGRLLCFHHHRLAHDDRYAKTRLPRGQIRFTRRQ